MSSPNASPSISGGFSFVGFNLPAPPASNETTSGSSSSLQSTFASISLSGGSAAAHNLAAANTSPTLLFGSSPAPSQPCIPSTTFAFGSSPADQLSQPSVPFPVSPSSGSGGAGRSAKSGSRARGAGKPRHHSALTPTRATLPFPLTSSDSPSPNAAVDVSPLVSSGFSFPAFDPGTGSTSQPTPKPLSFDFDSSDGGVSASAMSFTAAHPTSPPHGTTDAADTASAEVTEDVHLPSLSVSPAAAAAAADDGPVELRIGVVRPLPGEWTDNKKATGRLGRTNTKVDDKQTSYAAQQRTHIALPSKPNDTFYDLVQQLPHSQLVLTSFTITAAADGSPVCQSTTSDSQAEFDEMMAALLPLDTPLCVSGVAANLDQRLGLRDEVHIRFTMMLSEADAQSIAQLKDDTPSSPARQKRLKRLTTPSTPSTATTPPPPPPPPPRLATVDDPSVRLTTSFRLLADLTVPLSAGLGWEGGRSEAAVRRLCARQVARGDCVVVFDVAGDVDEAALQTVIRVSDIVPHHRQRLSAVAKTGFTPSVPKPNLDDLCPTARLSSLVLLFAPASLSEQQATVAELEVQAESDVQLRGFHFVRPRLRFQLGSRDADFVDMAGVVRATFSCAGGEVAVECAEASLGPTGVLTVKGECVSVASFADILATQQRLQAPQPKPSATSLPTATPPLSSCTALPWTLDGILARQLPHLVPCDSLSTDEQSKAQCTAMYYLEQHAISQIMHRNVTLRFSDPLTSSSTTPPLSLQLNSPLAGIGYSPSNLVTFNLTATTPMSLNQLLAIIKLPASLVPEALLDRVHFGRFTAQLIVHAATGVAHCLAGSADCGPSKRDKLLFFNRLATTHLTLAEGDVPDEPPLGLGDLFVDGLRASESVTSAADTAATTEQQRKESAQQSADTAELKWVTQWPLQRWLRLGSRAVLDPSVFPQLATLTAQIALEPLYTYVLCETTSGVKLSDEQVKRFHDGYKQTLPIYPASLKPTNAVYALQPHLPSGYFELPVSALTLPPASTSPPGHTATDFSSSTSLSASSAVSRAFLQLAEGSSELFRQCVDYLDANSLLFGLLPAVHSLPAVTAAIANSTYGRRALISRYGACSDAALWSGALLMKWREEGFEQHVASETKGRVARRVEGREASERVETELLEQVDRERRRAHKHDVYWAAIIDLQTRINKYLILVMLQRREDILPQLYQRAHAIALPPRDAAVSPPGTMRPVYQTVPRAALELLMCVAPFHPLPAAWKDVDNPHHDVRLATGHQRTAESKALNSASPHRAAFAPFLSSLSEQCQWSLYMGPVYVYADEHTAGLGYEVDMSDPSTFRNVDGKPLSELRHMHGVQYKNDTAVRLTHLDDAELLPIVPCRWLPGGSAGQRMPHQPHRATLAACFSSQGVSTLIADTRHKWRRVATKHANTQQWKHKQQQQASENDGKEEKAAAEKEEEKETKEEDKQEEQEEKKEEAEERKDVAGEAKKVGDGVTIEYVELLQQALLESLDEAKSQ